MAAPQISSRTTSANLFSPVEVTNQNRVVLPEVAQTLPSSRGATGNQGRTFGPSELDVNGQQNTSLSRKNLLYNQQIQNDGRSTGSSQIVPNVLNSVTNQPYSTGTYGRPLTSSQNLSNVKSFYNTSPQPQQTTQYFVTSPTYNQSRNETTRQVTNSPGYSRNQGSGPFQSDMQTFDMYGGYSNTQQFQASPASAQFTNPTRQRSESNPTHYTMPISTPPPQVNRKVSVDGIVLQPSYRRVAPPFHQAVMITPQVSLPPPQQFAPQQGESLHPLHQQSANFIGVEGQNGSLMMGRSLLQSRSGILSEAELEVDRRTFI
ncbi:hypothetical protein HK096_010621 [Nowakowskiella sp. JEL0078]|nr:hypothetical protein HK096_010621 [Nowakowskiella sp. JEL0078]